MDTYCWKKMQGKTWLLRDNFSDFVYVGHLLSSYQVPIDSGCDNLSSIQVMLQGMPWQRVPVADNWIILNPERAGNYQLSVRVENNEGKYSMSDSLTVIVRGTSIRE